eukprot:7479198-Pyramimonas_sp.AAC.1
MDVLDHKQHEWAQLWAPPDMEVDGMTRDIREFGELFSEIRARVRDEALPPLTVPDSRMALGRMKVNGAMGVGGLSVHDPARLPGAALRVLCHVLGARGSAAPASSDIFNSWSAVTKEDIRCQKNWTAVIFRSGLAPGSRGSRAPVGGRVRRTMG